MRRRAISFMLPLLAATALGQANISRWTSVRPLPEGYVNRANADLHLEFPIFNRPTGTKAQINAVLVYDSQFWQVENGAWAPEGSGGWWLRTAASAHVDETISRQSGACGWTDGGGTDDGSGAITTYTLAFTEPDGTVATAGSYIAVYAPYKVHPEGYYNDCPPSDPLPQVFPIADGKGFQVNVDGSGTATAW